MIIGKIAVRTRKLIRTICQRNEVEIMAGHVGTDHIHMLVSVPPHLSASKLVQYIKGATSRKLQMEYKELNKQFWEQHFTGFQYFDKIHRGSSENLHTLSDTLLTNKKIWRRAPCTASSPNIFQAILIFQSQIINHKTSTSPSGKFIPFSSRHTILGFQQLN